MNLKHSRNLFSYFFTEHNLPHEDNDKVEEFVKSIN